MIKEIGFYRSEICSVVIEEEVVIDSVLVVFFF